MPLQRQAGFIYDLPNHLELIAHELGHGAFNLRHTFSNDGFIAAQGSTDNLMDYKNGTELWMHQWKSVQDPEHVWLSFLEGEEEGEWTTDGHYYTVQLVALMMGIDEKTAQKLGKAAEEPDSHVISDMDMEEKDTWMIGGLQEKYHALTGGFHGVELAVTAYALTRTHTDEESLFYLLHRFGDDFAHFNIIHDNDGLTTNIKLIDYIEGLERYINQLIENKFVFNPHFKLPQLPENVLWKSYLTQESGKIETNYSKEEIIKQFIDFLLKAEHGSMFAGSINLKWEQCCDDILKYLPSAIQNNFKMYGKIQILKCFTFGHASDGSAPDNIVDRYKLYLLYVSDLVDLLSIKYKISTTDVIKENIQNKFSLIIDHVKISSIDRLDGILAYEFAKLKSGSQNKIRFYIPIKYTVNENLTTAGTIYNAKENISGFEEKAESIKKDTYTYFDKTGAFRDFFIEDKIVSKNGIKYIEFNMTKWNQ
jgi:hypothetical protein